MPTLLQADHPDAWRDFRAPPAFPLLSPEEWSLLPPDAHFILHTDGFVHARCSVWTESLPPHDGARPGAVGHFECVDAPAGEALLGAACGHLLGRGVRLAIGPINGNTWMKYRLVTGGGKRPPFLLEPFHPAFYVEAWRRAGFEPLTEFHSGLFPPQVDDDPRLDRVRSRLDALGIRIRNLDVSRFDDDLRAIHAVSTVSFSANLLYSPISADTILALYQPLKPRLQPEFVWIAEHEDRCVGFCFAIPDLAQAQRGQPVDTLVVKSLATLPERAYAGLGLLLTQRAHQAAAAAGFHAVIHALMHPGSRIKHFGKAEMEVFRTYTLFQRRL